MILEEETLKEFGYKTSCLSQGASKKVVMLCDYCKDQYTTTNKSYCKGRKDIDKDCCYKCRSKKRSEISLKKHGVSNPFQREEVKEKSKLTNKKKRGVEYAMQSRTVRDKSKQTCLNKYGVENPAKSQTVQDKYRQTCMDKYGVENVSSLKKVKDKRKETNLEKFGHEYYVASDHCKQKVRERHGVDNVFQLESVKKKIIETRKSSGNIKVFNGKTVQEWSDNIGFSRNHFNKLVNDHGWEYAVNCAPDMTNIEQLVANILDKNDIVFESRKRFGSVYPDFLITDHNLVIECDGLYWHSDAVQVDNNYHVKKKNIYEESGLRSLFFRQNEIINRPDIIESIILNKTGNSKRVFARKLKLDTIGSKRAKLFLEENHLMGNGRGQSFILHDGDQVVSLIQMRRVKGNNWEVSRFCSKLGYSIIGGFTRLLSFFESKNDPDSIITFIDKRYGDGQYLTLHKFELISCHKSFKWTDSVSTFHRMKFPSNTGYDNGLYKIWDCGQAKYKKDIRGVLLDM